MVRGMDRGRHGGVGGGLGGRLGRSVRGSLGGGVAPPLSAAALRRCGPRGIRGLRRLGGLRSPAASARPWRSARGACAARDSPRPGTAPRPRPLALASPANAAWAVSTCPGACTIASSRARASAARAASTIRHRVTGMKPRSLPRSSRIAAAAASRARYASQIAGPWVRRPTSWAVRGRRALGQAGQGRVEPVVAGRRVVQHHDPAAGDPGPPARRQPDQFRAPQPERDPLPGGDHPAGGPDGQ